MNFFKNRSILITGGTGSFGFKLLSYLLTLKSNRPKKVIVFSRDELKQFEMEKEFNLKKYPYDITVQLAGIRKQRPTHF